jgi:O-antigen/teichoic acid export membrane protein
VLRNIGSTWVVTLVTIAATYVLTPFLIRSLGAKDTGPDVDHGVTGYVSLMALGVPMACVRYSGHVAERDTARPTR